MSRHQSEKMRDGDSFGKPGAAAPEHQRLDVAATKPWRRFVPAWLRALLWIDSATRYDAFLSYSWSADGAVAPAIQTLLQGFLRPWYAVRAKTIFRDLSCLPAGSSLEAELFDRLDRSEHLIVLACPDAARSRGMEAEAAHWFSRARAGQVLIVVTDGTCRTWEPIREQLLPPSLRANLVQEPLFVLLQDRREQILRDPQAVHEELIEDLKQVILRLHPGRDWGQLRGLERRYRRIALGLIGSVLVVLTALTIRLWTEQRRATRGEAEARKQTGIAETNATRAREQEELAKENARQAQESARLAEQRERLARSRALAIQSRETRGLPDTSLLLSLAAIHAEETLDAKSAMLGALFTYPRLESSLYAWHPAANRAVQALAVSPSGEVMAAGYRDGALIVWRSGEAAGSYLRRPQPGWSSGVSALAFDANGRHLSGAIADGTIETWRLQDRRLLPRIQLTDARGASANSPSGSNPATALAFHPVTGFLAVGQYDGRVRVWNVLTASPVGGEFGDPIPADLNDHTIGVQALAFSGDGAFLASGHGGHIQRTDGMIRLWDANEGYRPGRVLNTGTNGVRALAMGRSKKWLAYPTATATVRVEDVDLDGTQPRSFETRVTGLPAGARVTNIAFGASDAMLAASFSDGQLALWHDPGTKHEDSAIPNLFPSGHVQDIAGIAFLGMKNLIATAGTDGVVRLWHTQRESAGIAVGDASPAYDVTFSPEGTRLAAVGVSGTLEWWDVQGRHKLRELSLGNNDHGVAVSFIDEKSVDVLTHSGQLLRCTERTCRTVPRAGRIERTQSRSFGPHGRFWFEWLADRPYRCTVTRCEGLPGPGTVDHEPAAASRDGLRWTVRGWEAGGAPGGRASLCQASGCQTLDLGPLGPSSWVGGMTFSPTGALLAVGTGDGSVTFFDGRTGARLSPPIAAPQGGIEHVAFSPDEVLMVSGGRDGTVLLWDVATRQPLGSPLQRPGIDQVRALVFHPTGRTVLIQYSSGHLTELSVDLVHYWQRRACQAAGRDHAPLEWMRYGAGLPLESVCQDLIVPGADWEPRPASLR